MLENPVKEISHVLLPSKVFRNEAELVLVVGYTPSGKFGYFITYLTNEKEYINTISFIVKSNEESYAKILVEFKEVVDSLKGS